MIDTIALCMVVYNEAHRIADTLDAAWPHVDQAVIVDQSSTDDTQMAIARWISNQARGFTPVDVKVIKDKHWGYCEPSRKKAHDATWADWILVLDADERISDQFAADIRRVNERSVSGSQKTVGVRLKRSLWLSGAHHFTGDHQYRFFQRNAVKYLDEIHTEPQPLSKADIWSPTYVGIWHEKSWSEQIRDEQAYEGILKDQGASAQKKLDLNVHLKKLDELGMTAEEMDALPVEKRMELLGLKEFKE